MTGFPTPPGTFGALDRRSFLRRAGGTLLAGASVTSVGSLVAGCGDGGGKTKDLSLWNFYGPDDQNSPASKWFVSLVDTWNKNNNVKIKLKYIPNQDYISGNVLQTAFSSGAGPDIFIVSPGDFLRYANGKVLTDLTPQVSAAKSDFISGVLDTRMVDGKVYAVPMEVEPLAMYYSVKAFEDAKLSEADVPQTWDQLLDVAQKLTTSKRFGVGFETTPGYYQNFTWYPLMWSGGGEPVGKDGKSSAFNSPAVIGALDLWQKTIKTGIAPKKLSGMGGNDIVPNLVAGTVAMQNTGIWSLGDLRNKAKDFKFGVAKYPLPPGGKHVTDMGGWAFAANAKGRDPETAAKFIAWALADTSPEGVERCRQWNTVAKSNVPARTSVTRAAEKAGAFNDPGMKKFLTDIVPGGHAEPRYPAEVYKAISDAIQAAQLGGTEPAKAAADAAEKIDAYLKSYQGAPIL